MLKFPIPKGTKTSLHYPLKETKNFPSKQKKGNPKTSLQYKNFQTPRAKSQKIKFKDNNWGVKTGTTKSTHATNVYFLLFTVRCTVCVGSRLFVFSLGRTFFPFGVFVTCESVFSYSPPRGYRETVKTFLFAPSGLSGNRENVFSHSPPSGLSWKSSLARKCVLLTSLTFFINLLGGFFRRVRGCLCSYL